MEHLGKKQWVIPDGYMSDSQNGNLVSHEAVCVLNLTDIEAKIVITIFFEDREPIKGFSVTCMPQRTNHIRLDKIVNTDGLKIPHEVSYAILIESNTPIICQHSRMDVTQNEMALMTTIAY